MTRASPPEGTVTRFACYGNEGDMPYEDVMRSIELIGKEVIPALHEVKLQPYE